MPPSFPVIWIVFFSCFMILIFFRCIAWEPSYSYMYTFFPPSFVLLQYRYLDIVLDATQQDLLVNPFQVVSDNPKLLIPPTPSLSPWAATSLFSKSIMIVIFYISLCFGEDYGR